LTSCSAVITRLRKQLSYIQSGQKYSNQDKDDFTKTKQCAANRKKKNTGHDLVVTGGMKSTRPFMIHFRYYG